MKYVITILILISNLTYSQQKISVEKDSTVYRFKNCDEGRNEAQIAFSKGIYNSVSYGLIIHRNPKFDTFLVNYRKEKYGIISKTGGCVVTDYTECYSEKMRDLIFKKFGNDIFERSKKEAEKLWRE
ncbi:hypothetical protein [Flavobacterium sp.]|uniref:hypothetical protein n=1 Tax=Flavobacterium sp. TaxID=239 RepID=UPI0032649AE4